LAKAREGNEGIKDTQRKSGEKIGMVERLRINWGERKGLEGAPRWREKRALFFSSPLSNGSLRKGKSLESLLAFALSPLGVLGSGEGCL